ncbi:MAG: RnfABCDGE type electron transport complex subunit B [Bacteroidota bacterium]
MSDTLFIALTTMGGLGFIFASALAIAYKKLQVEENPMIAEINDILPNANCGACGKAGCYDFAVNVVDQKVDVNACPVGGEEVANSIADILGVESSSAVKIVPRILCRGGDAEAKKKPTNYSGPLSCSVMEIVAGGDKLCDYGCLGGGDCVTACPFGVMIMTDNNLPEVIEELCTGCGLCAKACPKNIIEMHPSDRNVFVFCKSNDDPKKASAVCSVSCRACAICAKNTDGGVVMNNFLAEINYKLFDESKIPFEKCRTEAIDYLNKTAEIENVQ